MNLQEKLIISRKQKGFTQDQLSKELQVTRQTVSRWEHGAVLPSMDSLRRLSQLYGVSLDYFIDEEMGEVVPTTETTVSVTQEQNSEKQMSCDGKVEEEICTTMNEKNNVQPFLNKCINKRSVIAVSAIIAFVICVVCIIIFIYLRSGGLEDSISQEIISFSELEDASQATSSGETFSLEW